MNNLLQFNGAQSMLPAAAFSPERNDLQSAVERMVHVAEQSGYDDPRAFVNLPEDQGLVKSVEEVVRGIDTGALTHVLLVGIGGSSLGMRAIAHTIPPSGPRILVAETVSAYETEAIIATLDREVNSVEGIVVIVASKSGATTETAANAALYIEFLTKKFGSIAHRVVVATDEGSPLAEIAAQEGYRCVPIPKMVGGRYSALSSAGLLPFGLARGNMNGLLEGARTARATFLREGTVSVAAQYGAALASYAQAGQRTHNMFVFDPALEDLGKWWRQLVGESLGKNETRAGGVSETSILPTVSVGSTDLHSVGQLYLSGAPGIATTFVAVDQPEMIIPAHSIAERLVSGLGGASSGTITDAILEGTKRAYTEKKLPYLSIRLRDLSPEAMGAFMETQMIAVVIAGELLDINAFDQPNVEDYKRITHGLLSGGVGI